MTIKKMLLLASMALAAIAFAAPAAAQAEPEWDLNGETLEGNVGFTAEGGITSDGGISTGPANVFFEGTLFNDETGMASGAIEVAEIENVHVPTNLPGCTATGTINNASLPWTVTGTGAEAPFTLDISSPTFTNHYFEGGNPGCAKFGVPSTVSVDGTVTGSISEEACISLENHKDDMFVENPITGGTTTSQVDLTGEGICIESGAGAISIT